MKREWVWNGIGSQQKDGSEIDVEISLSNYQINNDNYVIAFINNVTLRRKAEAKIEKLYNELEVVVEQRTKDLKKALLDFKKPRLNWIKRLHFRKQ
ncbi:MAG: PAS domain S-box protein [Chitinophagaceae bacterium]|nr:PAS domain S-box protein [Chitinophagaceae bacterium]